MTNNTNALVLYRRTREPSPTVLHCREIELCLDEDGRHVLLSRFVERYGDEDDAWASTTHHRVPLTQLMRWIISHGKEAAQR